MLLSDHSQPAGRSISRRVRTLTPRPAQTSVKIERLAGYYLLNYVMIVALLTAVSWLAFFIDPLCAECDARTRRHQATRRRLWPCRAPRAHGALCGA